MSLSWFGGDSLFTGPCEREVSKRVSCGYTPTGGRDDKRVFYEQVLIVKFFLLRRADTRRPTTW